MEDLKTQLARIEKKLDELEEGKKSRWFMEKVFPVLMTAVLGVFSLFLGWNQLNISNNQVKLQGNEIELRKLQEKIALDHEYVALVYEDVISGDDQSKSSALKLIKKMRPEIAIAFVELFEQKELTEAQKYDIEEIQTAYTNTLAQEKITIGIHRLNYNHKDSLSVINNRLKKSKFELIGNFHHTHRLNWMANESTVFYYGDEVSKKRAESLAKELELITNISFKVTKGAGLGVDKNRKDFHHFIHIIN